MTVPHRLSRHLETRGAAVAITLALAALVWAIGIRRYAGTASLFDLEFIMGPTARSLVERGTSCTLLQLHNFQLHDIGQTALEFCAHRRVFVPGLLALAALSGVLLEYRSRLGNIELRLSGHGFQGLRQTIF